MTPKSEKSGHIVATSETKKQKWAKTHSNYWKDAIFKNSRRVNGKTVVDSAYTARIAHNGKRDRFPLKTANKNEAAKKAAAIYRDVVSMGWEESLKLHKPHAQRNKSLRAGVTVGEFIELARSLSSARERTLDEYAKAFRRIVAGAFNIGEGHKYDAKKGVELPRKSGHEKLGLFGFSLG